MGLLPCVRSQKEALAKSALKLNTRAAPLCKWSKHSQQEPRAARSLFWRQTDLTQSLFKTGPPSFFFLLGFSPIGRTVFAPANTPQAAPRRTQRVEAGGASSSSARSRCLFCFADNYPPPGAAWSFSASDDALAAAAAGNRIPARRVRAWVREEQKTLSWAQTRGIKETRRGESALGRRQRRRVAGTTA